MSSTGSHCHVEGAVDSMSAYMQDATHGLNAVLTEIRTESSLSAAQLPAIVQFDDWQFFPDSLLYATVLGPSFRGATGEGEGRTNSPGYRRGEVDLEVYVMVAISKLAAAAARRQVATVNIAASRYAAAVHRMLMSRPGRGQSLNAGSGRGAAKIVNIFNVSQDLRADTGLVTEPNFVVVTTLSVRTSEE